MVFWTKNTLMHWTKDIKWYLHRKSECCLNWMLNIVLIFSALIQQFKITSCRVHCSVWAVHIMSYRSSINFITKIISESCEFCSNIQPVDFQYKISDFSLYQLVDLLPTFKFYRTIQLTNKCWTVLLWTVCDFGKPANYTTQHKKPKT